MCFFNCFDHYCRFAMFSAVNVSEDSLVMFKETLLDLGVCRLWLIVNNF